MRAGFERYRSLSRWTLLLAALSFLTVLISVFLRLDAGYPACAGNEDCFRGLDIGGLQLPVAAIRALHRATASTSLVLALFVAWKCLRPRPIQPSARHSLALLMLMLLLAAVGLLGADAGATWVRFANILGGIGLISVSGRLAIAARFPGAEAPGPVPNRILLAGLAALTATLIIGASIGARFAATACPSVPDCEGAWWPAAESWAGLGPAALMSSAPLSAQTAAALHLLHRYCALAAVMLIGLAGIRGLREPGTRRAAMSLLVLLVLAAILGGLTAWTAIDYWLATGHALLSGLLLIAIHWLRSAERRVAGADFFSPTVRAAP